MGGDAVDMKRTALFAAASLLIGLTVGYVVGRGAGPKLLFRERGADGELLLGEPTANTRYPLARTPRPSPRPETNQAANPGEPIETEEELSAGGQPASLSTWLEQLKEAEPEAYVDTTNYWAKYRTERMDRAQARLDFLASIDTHGMGDTAQKRLMQLADATVELEEVENLLWEGDITSAERAELMEKVRAKDYEVQQLAAKSRNDLLRCLAHRLGCPPEEVGEVVKTIRAVYDFTNPRSTPIQFPF